MDDTDEVISFVKQKCCRARTAFYVCIERESNNKPIETAPGLLFCPAKCKTVEAMSSMNCEFPELVSLCDRQYCEKMKKKKVQRPSSDKDDSKKGSNIQRPVAKDDKKQGPKSLLKGIRIIGQVQRPTDNESGRGAKPLPKDVITID